MFRNILPIASVICELMLSAAWTVLLGFELYKVVEPLLWDAVSIGGEATSVGALTSVHVRERPSRHSWRRHELRVPPPRREQSVPSS